VVQIFHSKAFGFAGGNDMHVVLPADLGCGGIVDPERALNPELEVWSVLVACSTTG